ncbi:MAG: MBL fold metallo-hydrolase [Candidatus Paceibacterota bacterium]|jgi:L-ascorbate metabolism protein UlaG (beta-lactamase superfamily)
MVITYYGLASYKIQFGDTIIAFNPVSKESAYKGSKFGADLVMVSMHHPDYNGISECTFGSKVPFVVDGPGEYETKDIYIKGVGIEQVVNNEKKFNTIYSVLFEGARLCHLGALNVKDISADVIEQLGEIDLLFVPITGGEVLTPAMAADVATTLEPKLVIPMHAGVKGIDKALLQQFLKAYGDEGAKPIDKLTLRKKDLEGKEGDVVIIDPVSS